MHSSMASAAELQVLTGGKDPRVVHVDGMSKAW